ncbi:lectin C-type domain protein [Teladorsagia circumcincta]|uniref:Lectin C-type domain protein n=1 Tax=Teladorsagia circumcincta TaxID=45464 RepID=A0A2G9U6K4_TELCI|nr:lectin C-type domain protein [Teladorsagia circumcincta]
MGRTAITILLSLAVVLHSATAIRFAANDEAPVEPASIRPSKSAPQLSNLHQKEWLAGPNGYLYQFHAGDQSWLAAREYCLAQNSDLVILRDAKQIDWLLSHYAPTYARFAERYIQVGLMIPDGPSRDWMYLDGSKYNQSVISWMSGEPFDHTTDGLERCALLRVHARVLDDVDCEASPRNQMPVRFICERSDARHKEQQLSKNFIWGKLEQLLEYFGFGNTAPSKKANSTNIVEEDYVDEVSKLNITSTEREMLKKIRLFETSSEEEREVLSALRNLNNDSSKHQHEIDPEKLEKIINTMEKMVANLENISIIEKRPDIKSKAGKDQGEAEKEIRKKEATKEDSQKSETRKKVKANDALVSISKPDTEDGADQADMEKDFDEKLNKKMPTTDIKPPVDEDCEEGASGEKPTTQTPPEAVVRNAIDTEDVDDLSQKPKIPVEREEHIQDFLKTLRTFLSRAEHSDLRKLLDNNPGKSLLEKMKLAIAAANEREFARLKELELMKKHGVDISNVPEPQLIADSEREDLFKKISGVVMEEAEKQGLETATEPSARTTTQETSRSTTEVEVACSPPVIVRSNYSEGSKSHEELEEEVPSTQVPKENDDDHGVEVGTEKTPQAKRAERMRLAREKKAQLEKAKEVKKAEESSSEEDEHDSTNPLGLPTLPPPPTLAPLPSLETVLDNLGKQWKKLFPPPKSFRV